MVEMSQGKYNPAAGIAQSSTRYPTSVQDYAQNIPVIIDSHKHKYAGMGLHSVVCFKCYAQVPPSPIAALLPQL